MNIETNLEGAKNNKKYNFSLLELFSLSQAFYFFYFFFYFINNTEFKTVWSPPGIEPRTAS